MVALLVGSNPLGGAPNQCYCHTGCNHMTCRCGERFDWEATAEAKIAASVTFEAREPAAPMAGPARTEISLTGQAGVSLTGRIAACLAGVRNPTRLLPQGRSRLA